MAESFPLFSKVSSSVIVAIQGLRVDMYRKHNSNKLALLHVVVFLDYPADHLIMLAMRTLGHHNRFSESNVRVMAQRSHSPRYLWSVNSGENFVIQFNSIVHVCNVCSMFMYGTDN